MFGVSLGVTKPSDSPDIQHWCGFRGVIRLLHGHQEILGRRRSPPPSFSDLDVKAHLVSCSANSWLKTRRESAPCGVTSPRRACRSAEEGPLRGSDRGDTRKAGGRHALGRLHGRIPAGGGPAQRSDAPSLGALQIKVGAPAQRFGAPSPGRRGEIYGAELACRPIPQESIGGQAGAVDNFSQTCSKPGSVR